MIVLAGSTSAAIAIAVHVPVLTAQPLYALINVAVTSVVTMVGTYLVVSEQERFTGIAFIFAGALYPVNDLDIYPGWAAYVSYIFGGGALFYGAISWGVLRYGRRHLEYLSERIFIPICFFFASGSGILAMSFARPEWLGFPADSKWLTVWPNRTAFSVAGVVVCAGFVFIAVYFTSLMVRRVRATPAVSRGSLQPLAAFGSVLALGSAGIYTIETLAPDLVAFHTLMNLVGVLTLGVAGALITAVVRHQLLAAHLVEQLPEVHTPRSLNAYIRHFLRDDSAKLLFWSPDNKSLIDEDGLARALLGELGPDRMRSWITGSDGTRVALLTCDPSLRRDPSSLASLGRVVSLIADNARLNALLAMRVAQLTATRTAEQLALAKARESFRRDLHDGVQQTIASIRLDVDGLHELIGDTPAWATVDLVSRKLTTALDQIRNLKSGSRPPELQFGLKAAIERCVAELRIDAQVDIPEGDLGILTMPVYYVVREALTNVHKHSHASHANVLVTTDMRMISIVVKDDGNGGATLRDGGGLAGVRERVKELSGALRLDSPWGRGTTLEVKIPCV